MSATIVNPETAAATASAQARGRTGLGWMSLLQSLLRTIVIAIFVITFIVQAFRIPSASMENTLLVGDYLLVDKAHYGSSPLLSALLPYHGIQRDDIVVFRFPVDPEQHFVKRVIGLPGDRVKIVHSAVYVNGKLLQEPYVLRGSRKYDAYNNEFPNGRYIHPNVEARWYDEMHEFTDERGELIVPQGNYFVMGDNRDNSSDSRYWGFVPRENILGRPLVVYFSVNREQEMSGSDMAVAGALPQLSYDLKHIPETIRWRRCLRLIF